MEAQKIIKRVLVGLGIALIVGYSVFALEGFIRGPRIEIATPESVHGGGIRYFSYATTTALVLVSGRVINANMLFINGAETPQNLVGNFSESLLLAPGYNIMSVEAKDRYGRTVKKTIEMTLLVESRSTGLSSTSVDDKSKVDTSQKGDPFLRQVDTMVTSTTTPINF